MFCFSDFHTSMLVDVSNLAQESDFRFGCINLLPYTKVSLLEAKNGLSEGKNCRGYLVKVSVWMRSSAQGGEVTRMLYFHTPNENAFVEASNLTQESDFCFRRMKLLPSAKVSLLDQIRGLYEGKNCWGYLRFGRVAAVAVCNGRNGYCGSVQVLVAGAGWRRNS